jgi:hypothetical protein
VINREQISIIKDIEAKYAGLGPGILWARAVGLWGGSRSAGKWRINWAGSAHVEMREVDWRRRRCDRERIDSGKGGYDCREGGGFDAQESA